MSIKTNKNVDVDLTSLFEKLEKKSEKEKNMQTNLAYYNYDVFKIYRENYEEISEYCGTQDCISIVVDNGEEFTAEWKEFRNKASEEEIKEFLKYANSIFKTNIIAKDIAEKTNICENNVYSIMKNIYTAFNLQSCIDFNTVINNLKPYFKKFREISKGLEDNKKSLFCSLVYTMYPIFLLSNLQTDEKYCF